MKEIMNAIETMHDEDNMANFIKGLDSYGCYKLMNILRYTKEETEIRWLDVYSKMFKY